MKRRISALFLLVTFVGGQVALAEQDPRTGRLLQRDPHYTGAPIINDTTFHGRAPMVDLPQPTPRLHYLNGMNIYQYVGSNPVNRNDPLGLFFFGGGYADVLTTAYWEADLRASDAARVGIAAMFLTAMLGSMITANQWGVTGGMSGAGFDVFLEGVDAAMSGAHALGESLMQSATTMTVLAVYSVSQSEAVQKCRELLPQLMLHAAKVATGGPDNQNFNQWIAEMRAWLNKIAQKTADMKGKTQESWRRFAEDFFRWLENRMGPPPVAPG